MVTQTVKVAVPGMDAAMEAVRNPRALVAAAAGSVANSLRRHFRSRNAMPNAMGWPKKNFWNREGAEKVAIQDVAADSATVVVASAAIAHKVTGGTIRPGAGRKMLAIPLSAEAYRAGGPALGVIPGLFLVVRKGAMGRAFLAVKDGDEIKVHYLLKASVTQAADPMALPPLEAMEQAAGRAAASALRREIEQARNVA